MNIINGDEKDEKIEEIKRLKTIFGFSGIDEEECANQSLNNKYREHSIFNSSEMSNRAKHNSENNEMISFMNQSSLNDSLISKKINNKVDNNDFALNTLLKMIHNNYNDIVEYGDEKKDEKNLNDSHKEGIKFLSLNNDTFINKYDSNNNDLFKSIYSQKVPPNGTYKFIIGDKNSKNEKNKNNNTFNQKNKINGKKFNSLSDIGIYHILQFLYCDYNLLISNQYPKFISNKIHLALNNLFNHSIINFRELYKDKLELSEFYFKYDQFKKERYIYPILDLVIKSKILSDDYDSSLSLSIKFNYVHINRIEVYQKEKNNYIQTIKLDIKKKGKCNFWICSEYEEYKGNLKRICYLQPVLSYSKNDNIIFKINIFSVDGYILPNSLEFIPLKIEKIQNSKNKSYDKLYIKQRNFDILRDCEIEMIVHLWKNITSLSNHEIINNVSSIYSSFFDIEDVQYDITKFYIFKFKMKAKKKGKISKNKYINYEIEIVNDEEEITNESHFLGTLNTHYGNNKIITIRLNNILYIYLNDIYKN